MRNVAIPEGKSGLASQKFICVRDSCRSTLTMDLLAWMGVAMVPALALVILLPKASESPTSSGRVADARLLPVLHSRHLASSGISSSIPAVASAPPSRENARSTSAPAQGPDREACLAQIQEASSTYSPDGIPALAKLLDHPDPDIRDAAVEGFKQLGLPEGAAVLRAKAVVASDPHDATRLREAASFIDLPLYVPPKRQDRQPLPNPNGKPVQPIK